MIAHTSWVVFSQDISSMMMSEIENGIQMGKYEFLSSLASKGIRASILDIMVGPPQITDNGFKYKLVVVQ